MIRGTDRFRQTFAGAIFLVLCLAGTARSLPSNALLDSLALASAGHEQKGELAERDQAESLLEMLARSRIAADSAPEHPRSVLETLDRLRGQRVEREARELAELRPPMPEVARLRAEDTAVDFETVAPVPTVPSESNLAPSPPPPPPQILCAAGPVGIQWRSVERPHGSDSLLRLRAKVTAPCGLSRLDLFVDEVLTRGLPFPTGKGLAFDFTEAVPLSKGIHRIDIVACDSAGICIRSVPLESKLVEPVSPWIPRTVGALVGLCVLLGAALGLRRLSHHPSSFPSIHTAPLPPCSGVSAAIRHRLQLVAREMGATFPALSLRLPDDPPPLSIDPESLGEAFGNLLRLHARRCGNSGQILVALGEGPLHVEVVFEDTAPTPDEEIIPVLLDPARISLKERMGLDRELDAARQAIARGDGGLSMEARIDGGLRTRVRLKRAPRKTRS